jgi:hypothetical protein
VNNSWPNNLDKVADLGEGIMLVKFSTQRTDATLHRSGPRAHAGMAAVPAIPSNVQRFTPQQVRKLLEAYSAPSVPPSTVGRTRASPGAARARKALDKNEQFMENLRMQELVNRTRDIDEGRLITARELAERLQISTQAIGRAVQSKRMFTLDGPSGRKMYPAFFADRRFNREHIERVCQALGEWPGPAKWEFFTSPRASLDRQTPIEALARGDLDQVLRAATAFQDR